MVFNRVFISPLIILIQILFEKVCKLYFLWIDSLLQQPLSLPLCGGEYPRGRLVYPLPCSMVVGVDVHLEIGPIRRVRYQCFVYFALIFGNIFSSNSKDLSLIPSRREKDEDPEDEGGKALHVHYSTPTPCRDVVLSPWLRLDWSPRSQLGTRTWSDPARRSGPRLAFHRPQTVQQHLRLPALNQMTL